MRRMILGICTWMAVAAAIHAQPPGSGRTARRTFDATDSSGVQFYANNNGTFGFDSEHNSAGFIVPRGSATAYMFGSGLWIGARKQMGGDLKKMAFLTYNPNSGTSWATPGPYSDTEFDFASFNSRFYTPAGTWLPLTTPDTQNWPLWLRPGMQATPLTPGVYEPDESQRNADNGTYAAAAFIPGVYQQLVLRYSDKDVTRYEIRDASELAGYPLGLQIETNIYSWQRGPYMDAVVVQYELINKSSDTLHDCVVGQASDPDLGSIGNDHLSFYKEHPELRTAYAWTDQEDDTYRTLVMSIVEAPQTDAAGHVDNSNRVRYMLAGRVAACPNWIAITDPKTSAERYDFLSTPVFATDMGPDDQRAMMAGDKFTMYPGDTAHFAVLYAVADFIHGAPGKHEAPVISANAYDAIAAIVVPVTRDYYSPTGFNLVSAVPVTPRAAAADLTASPNPAIGQTTLRFTLPAPGTIRLKLVNSLGQTVLTQEQGALPAGPHALNLDIAGLPSGTYFAILDGAGTQSATRLAIVR